MAAGLKPIDMKFILSCLLLFPVLLWADKVATKDGSVIVGKVLNLEAGTLYIETEFSGKLEIPTSQILSITSDDVVSLRLEDNRTFNNKVVPAPDGLVGLDGNEQAFAFEELRHLWSEESEDPLIALEKKQAEALLMKWSHSIGFDLTGSSGNTDDFGLGLRADSDYGNQFREYELYLAYNKSSKKDVTVVDETKFGAEYDSRFYQNLAWYAKTDLENDRLEKIDLRATAATGLKYFWIKKDLYDLSARSGLAFRYEKYESSDSSDLSEPALDFGLEYSHKIKDLLSLESDLTFVPSVNDFEDFLLSNDLALVIPLDKKNNWNIRTGLNGTYNSTPVSGKDQLDLKYYLRLVYRLD